MKRTFDKQGSAFLVNVALAFATIVAYGGMLSLYLRHGTLSGERIHETLGWYALAFAAYAGMVWWQERHSYWNPGLVWGAALISYGLLLFTEPTLSTDVYRYLWDGHVANHGVSPYAYAIEAPALDALAVPMRDLANHTWMASPYLPAAQWLFAIVTRLFPLASWPMQLVMISLSLANGWLICRLLNRAGLPARRVVLYLWNPLVVVEAAHAAHVDIWMVLLLLAAIVVGWQASQRREVLSAVLLALAVLTKAIPILVAPVFGRRWRLSSWAVFGLVTAGAVATAAYTAGWGLTGPLDGSGVFGALRIYGDRWDFNSGIYRWLHVNLAEHMQGQVEPDRVAKGICAAVMAGVVIWAWWKAGSSAGLREDLRLMSIPLMAYILLSTTVHPWYLIPVLAFLPFWSPGNEEPGRQWLTTVPWLYLSGALMLSYLTYIDPQNLRDFLAVRRVEWVPTLVGLTLIYIWSLLRYANT